jgi:hypothetical protein
MKNSAFRLLKAGCKEHQQKSQRKPNEHEKPSESKNATQWENRKENVRSQTMNTKKEAGKGFSCPKLSYSLQLQ